MNCTYKYDYNICDIDFMQCISGQLIMIQQKKTQNTSHHVPLVKSFKNFFKHKS